MVQLYEFETFALGVEWLAEWLNGWQAQGALSTEQASNRASERAR
jgi:hypothetical protein